MMFLEFVLAFFDGNEKPKNYAQNQYAQAQVDLKQTTPIQSPYNASYVACLNNAAQKAINQGAPISAREIVKGFNTPDEKVLASSRSQPESKLKIWDYLAAVVDDERVTDGKASFATYRDFLNSQQNISGVDAATIAAVWGVETDYGKIMGKTNIINALGTLGCTNWRRTEYFNAELVAAIRIVAHGHVPASEFNGSWAGAFGQTQFMPTSFWRLAVDGNGDGIKNIIKEPKDALASTANFLKRSGWSNDEKWGYEVRVPASYNGAIGRNIRKPLSYWRENGLTLGNGASLPNAAGNYGIIFPAGRSGPGFLVGRNFNAVYSYNPAISYALAVNLLADRIKGGDKLYQSWPTDDPGISRAQKRQIQETLIAKGYDIGAPDGIIGPKTHSAISQLFGKNNITYDGNVGQKTYDKLMGIK